MRLKQVKIGENLYVNKFELSDKTIITEATTKLAYDSLATATPTKTDTKWVASSIRIGFDTPTGELSDGQYATQDNGFHWVKIEGYDMVKILPEYIKNDILSKEGEAKIKE